MDDTEDDSLTSRMDELTDRIDYYGVGWQDGDYSLLVEVWEYLTRQPERP
jgi:hypothetical protein